LILVEFFTWIESTFPESNRMKTVFISKI
jgi:hypothetical protein